MTNTMEDLIRELVALIDDAGDGRTLVDVLNSMGSGYATWNDARRVEFLVAEKISDASETVDTVLSSISTDSADDMWNE